MLKKLMLLLLLYSANMYAMEQPQTPIDATTNDSLIRDVFFVLTPVLVDVLGPKLATYIEHLKKSESKRQQLSEEELQRISTVCTCISLGVCAAVSVCGAVILYPLCKDIYGHFYPSETHDEIMIAFKAVCSLES